MCSHVPVCFVAVPNHHGIPLKSKHQEFASKWGSSFGRRLPRAAMDWTRGEVCCTSPGMRSMGARGHCLQKSPIPSPRASSPPLHSPRAGARRWRQRPSRRRARQRRLGRRRFANGPWLAPRPRAQATALARADAQRRRGAGGGFGSIQSLGKRTQPSLRQAMCVPAPAQPCKCVPISACTPRRANAYSAGRSAS